MTMQDAKLAALWRIPVVCQGITYLRISALSIRYSSEYEMEYRNFPRERAEAELEDRGGNSITIAKVKDVEPLESEKFYSRVKDYEDKLKNNNVDNK